jgi:hypothetical protein
VASQASGAGTVVLVEGDSDKAAIETLARRLDRDLKAESVVVIAIGGASQISRSLAQYGPEPRIAGLCDLAEEGQYREALERSGSSARDRAEMEGLGFFVCVTDLEDELIRALGTERVLEVIESEGELGAFRSFQNQPAWRGRPLDDQLHRFIGTFSGRKIRYGRLLVEALDLDRVPVPLAELLGYL